MRTDENIGEQVEDDEEYGNEIVTLSPLIGSTALAKYFEVSRQTIFRWRLVGFLPKPIKQGNAFFWRKSDILYWQKSGCPWSTPSLASTAIRHARANCYDLNKYIAPQHESQDTEELIAAMDQLEEKLNKMLFWVQLEEPIPLPTEERVNFLIQRLKELYGRADV